MIRESKSYQTWAILLILSACGAPPSTKSAQGNRQVATDCAEDDESEAALRLDEAEEDSESESDDTCESDSTESKPATKNGSGTNSATVQNPPITSPQPAAVTPALPSTNTGSSGGNPLGGLLGGLGGGGGGLGGLLGGLGGGGGGLGGLGSLLGGFGGGGGGLGGLGGLLGGLGGGGGGLGGLGGLLGGLGGGGGGLGGLLGGLGGGGGGSSAQQPAPAPAPAQVASGGTVTYSANIAPYLQRACVSCHSYLGNYSGARGAANSSLSRMKSGNMPTSGRASDSEISQFQAWVSAGTPQ